MIGRSMGMFGGDGTRVRRERRRWQRLPRLLIDSVGIVFRAAPREFTLNTALELVQGAASGLRLLAVRNLLAAMLIGPANHRYLSVIEQLLVLVALSTIVGLIGTYTTMQQQLIRELVQRHASRPVTEMATAIGLREFDDPTLHDRMRRAQDTAGVRPVMLTSAVLTLGASAMTMAGSAIALLLLSPLLLAVLLLGSVPLWLTTTRGSHALYEFVREMTPNDRKRDYVLGLLTGRGMAKEIRAFGLGPYLRSRYERLSGERITRLRQHLRRRAWISFAGSGGSSVIMGLTFAVLAWLILNGHIGPAAAAAAGLAMVQMAGLSQMIAYSCGQLYEASLFIEDLQAFTGRLPALHAARPRAPAPRGFHTITLQDVSFSYSSSPSAAPPSEGSPPGRMWMLDSIDPAMMVAGPPAREEDPQPSRSPALRGASLEIARGEVVALVGENGSGKSTLAKLICGLYQPDTGSVSWDGTDISTVDGDQLREQVTVIFQDFAQYWLSAQENIGVGRVARMSDLDGIRAAARMAGADQIIESWPEGYQALLGPVFENGKDLSIGQWQRMALARAFFRDAPLIILDEPTASLDARAEAELFARIRTLFRGRTVLLISHRFSSVRSADRIYVLKEGQVVERGTHEELIRERGLYAELFDLQAAAYLHD